MRNYCDEALAAAGIKPSGEARLISRCAADIEPEPVEWLWPGRIAIGKQTLIAGEAGLGKSQITTAMTAAVTTGGTWPCGEGRAPLGNVIIFSAEDGAADTVVPRLMAARADRQRVRLVSAVRAEDGKGRRAFNLQADLDLLADEIERFRRRAVSHHRPDQQLPRPEDRLARQCRGARDPEPVGEMAERLALPLCVTHPQGHRHHRHQPLHRLDRVRGGGPASSSWDADADERPPAVPPGQE